MLNLSTTVVLVAIISMSVVLIPSEKVLVVLPNEQTEIIYNVYTRTVTLESNFQVEITLNITRIDTIDRVKTSIVENFSFEKSFEFQFNQSGFYLFTIFSPQLIQINFTDTGFKAPLLLLAVLMILMKIFLYLWEANLIFIKSLCL